MRCQVQTSCVQRGLQLNQSVASIAVALEDWIEIRQVVTIYVRVCRVTLEECQPAFGCPIPASRPIADAVDRQIHCQPSARGVTIAADDVIVHHANGLSESIDNYRPAEIEAALFEIF